VLDARIYIVVAAYDLEGSRIRQQLLGSSSTE